MSSPVIDFRVRLPVELGPKLETPPEISGRYDEVLDISNKSAASLDDLLAAMDATRVDHAVVHAEYEFGDPADELNAAVARLVADYPDRFTGIGTVSMAPYDIMRAVEQIAQCSETGMVGITMEPSFFRMGINEGRLYPLYAKAAELGLMVCVHTGINYGVTHPIRNDHPLQLDDVACDFPDLTLIACHGGWPWVAEMVAVARKHPNVYMEFGGLAPKYIGAAGSGWEVMYRFMNSVLAGQVLHGTDWPVMAMDRSIGEWRGLGLKEPVLEALLGGNAARLLGRV
jgi:predicted TIM-barrel fold metal-dependent hydrolase